MGEDLFQKIPQWAPVVVMAGLLVDFLISRKFNSGYAKLKIFVLVVLAIYTYISYESPILAMLVEISDYFGLPEMWDNTFGSDKEYYEGFKDALWLTVLAHIVVYFVRQYLKQRSQPPSS